MFDVSDALAYDEDCIAPVHDDQEQTLEEVTSNAELMTITGEAPEICPICCETRPLVTLNQGMQQAT
jgi:hypothetical protein